MGSGGIPPLGPPVRRKTENRRRNTGIRNARVFRSPCSVFRTPRNTTLVAEGFVTCCLAFSPDMERCCLCDQANRAIRTSKLNTSLYLHTWPIDEVVFLGSQAKPSFEVSFTLRCFQRLSRPYIATRQCGWRHNRSTRGTFLPVLSY